MANRLSPRLVLDSRSCKRIEVGIVYRVVSFGRPGITFTLMNIVNCGFLYRGTDGPNPPGARESGISISREVPVLLARVFARSRSVRLRDTF